MDIADSIRQMPRLAATTFARLNPREQRLVIAFGGLVAASVLYVGVIEPIVMGRARLEQKITSLRADVDVIRQSAARINELEKSLARTSKTEATPADFSLFSFVDKAASATVTVGSVAAMNPSRRRVRDGEAESLVEVRITSVPLTEIVSFLRKVEEAPAPVFARRVELKRRYDDRTRFDATIVAAMIERP
jgi:type II secretory pathway component PulM